jgi:hypothetical protein
MTLPHSRWRPRPGNAPRATARRAGVDPTNGALRPLAEHLTDEDVATLKHLAQEGMGENTLRALASDLAYLEAWPPAATNKLPWPASESLALKFVAHHLGTPCSADPLHGMPDDVASSLRAAEVLRAAGPHAPSTVKRRLGSWGTLHRWKGQEGPSPRQAFGRR